MCYVRKTAKEIAASGRKMMTLEQWIHLGQKARDAGMLYLLLTGGEPLLWPDFWELYDALYEMGLLIGINTNGSLIDDNAIQRWKEHPPYRVNLTLYGASNDTYETLCHTRNVYSEVKKAIIKMAEAGLNIKLNCSLTPYNAADLQEMVAFAKEKKIPLTVSTYMYPPVRRDAGMTGQNDRFRPEEAAWYHMQRYCYQKVCESGEWKSTMQSRNFDILGHLGRIHDTLWNDARTKSRSAGKIVQYSMETVT